MARGKELEYKVASHTDRGRVREQNEDSILADPPLIALADGMGGHEAGEVASSLALETLAKWKEELTGKKGNDASRMLSDALLEANKAVFEKGRSDTALTGMGTTLTAVWLAENQAALAHVGDSRAYLLRGGTLQQLTEDQTLSQQWVRQGRLTEDEAKTSPQRHVLLQAVGTDPDDLDIETATVELEPGDRLLLASDGLYGMVTSDDAIRDALTMNIDPQAACRVLIDAANAAGGEDNISVVIVDVDGGPIASAGEGGSPVVVERPSAPHSRLDAIRRRPVVSAVAAAALALALLVGFFMLSAGPTLVLAARQGNVVVLDGKPGAEGERAKGEVVRVFEDERVRRFSQPVQDDLRAGIPVTSMSEAERLVARLPRVLGPKDTPTPTPAPSPSPGTSPEPSPTGSARPA